MFAKIWVIISQSEQLTNNAINNAYKLSRRSNITRAWNGGYDLVENGEIGRMQSSTRVKLVHIMHLITAISYRDNDIDSKIHHPTNVNHV